MKRKFLVLLAGLGAIAILTTSCAKAPQMEIDNAKASVEAARSAGAEKYVTAEFNALQDSLNAAMTMVEEQKSKFALFRNYKAPKAKLGNVSALAETVKQNAEVRKEEVKAEVQQSITETNLLIEQVKNLITKAPRGKEGKAAIEAIKGDLAVVEDSMEEVNTLVSEGDFATAQDKVDAAKQKAESLKTELEEVIAKVR